jgi:hypothetical protein
MLCPVTKENKKKINNQQAQQTPMPVKTKTWATLSFELQERALLA